MTAPLITPEQQAQLRQALADAGTTWLMFCRDWKLKRMEFAGMEAMNQETWPWAMSVLKKQQEEKTKGETEGRLR